MNKPFDGEPIWTKDEQEISKSSPCFQKENTPYVKKLTIVKFDQNDEGEYQCVCDTASTKATIKISGKKISNFNCSVIFLLYYSIEILEHIVLCYQWRYC